MAQFFGFISTLISHFISFIQSFWTSDGGSVGNEVIVELIVAALLALFTLSSKPLIGFLKRIKTLFSSNPTNPPALIPGGYWLPYGCLGRKAEYQRIRVTLKGRKPVVVYGVAGVGKTAVCSYFFQRFSKTNRNFTMPFVNLTNCVTPAGFFDAVRVAVGLDETANITDSFLLQYIFSNKLRYIYFDNWEDIQTALRGSKDYQSVCSFVNSLCSNGIHVLISSQEYGPQEWTNIPIGPLSDEYGRSLFMRQLKLRGKTVFSPIENQSLSDLLIEMENHPLTIILTASLINEFNSNINNLLESWYLARNETMSIRHYSLSTSLSMTWEAIRKVVGANLLWGILSMYRNDFPMAFFKYLSDVWIDGSDIHSSLDALRKYSLVSYNKENDAIRMLFPVKKQWRILAEDALFADCEKVWMAFIPRLFRASELLDNDDAILLRNKISADVHCFLDIVECSVCQCDLNWIFRCIEAMYQYYERSPIASLNFFDALKPLELPPITNAVVRKCTADILRLRKRREDDAKILSYYEDAKKVFAHHTMFHHWIDTYNCEGLFYYWTMNDTAKAIDLFQSAEKLAVEKGYSYGIAEAKKNLGVVYTESIGDYEIARTYLLDAKSFYEQCNNQIGIAHSVKRLGMISFSLREYDYAIQCFKAALSGYQSVAYYQGVGDTFARLCFALKDGGNGRELKRTIKEAEALLPKIPYEITRSDLKKAIQYGKT